MTDRAPSSRPRRPRASSPRPQKVAASRTAPATRYQIDVALSRPSPLAAGRLRRIARTVLAAENVSAATVSIALVAGDTMRRLNRTHLNHDNDTDVLSFLFESAAGRGRQIDGEVVVSVDMARRTAPRFGWSAAEELALYLVHGLLHLCGYDDRTDSDRRTMRGRERAILEELGIRPIEKSSSKRGIS